MDNNLINISEVSTFQFPKKYFYSDVSHSQQIQNGR